jgi:hypothetical protein
MIVHLSSCVQGPSCDLFFRSQIRPLKRYDPGNGDRGTLAFPRSEIAVAKIVAVGKSGTGYADEPVPTIPNQSPSFRSSNHYMSSILRIFCCTSRGRGFLVRFV